MYQQFAALPTRLNIFSDAAGVGSPFESCEVRNNKYFGAADISQDCKRRIFSLFCLIPAFLDTMQMYV